MISLASNNMHASNKVVNSGQGQVNTFVSKLHDYPKLQKFDDWQVPESWDYVMMLKLCELPMTNKQCTS